MPYINTIDINGTTYHLKNLTDGNYVVDLPELNKNDITYLYPELSNIKKIVNKNVIFDGEIVIFENNKPSFNKISKRSKLKNKNIIQSFLMDHLSQ